MKLKLIILLIFSAITALAIYDLKPKNLLDSCRDGWHIGEQLYIDGDKSWCDEREKHEDKNGQL